MVKAGCAKQRWSCVLSVGVGGPTVASPADSFDFTTPFDADELLVAGGETCAHIAWKPLHVGDSSHPSNAAIYRLFPFLLAVQHTIIAVITRGNRRRGGKLRPGDLGLVYSDPCGTARRS